jgi:hypothetical protein
MASGMGMRSLLVNRQARWMQCLAVLQVLAARRRPSSAKLARGIRRAAATSSARVLTWLFLNPTHTLIIQQTTSVNFMVVPSIGSVGTGRPFLNMYERDTSGRPPFFLHFFQPTPPRCLQEDFGGTAMFPAPRAKLGMGQHRLGQAAHGNPFAQTCPLRG